jgi:hypothetical protein
MKNVMEMILTKHNVCETIENFLKENKIRFSIEISDNTGVFYELYISSISGFIQVEYNLDKEDDNDIHIQFFSKIDTNGNSQYESNWSNYGENQDSIEAEIEALISGIKTINQGIAKIEAKINQIKDICEEYSLEIDNFISIEYDFDNF